MIVIGGNGGGPSEGGGVVEGMVMVGTVEVDPMSVRTFPSEENPVSRSPGEACADGIPPTRRTRVASAATRRPMLLPARCHAFMADERSRRT